MSQSSVLSSENWYKIGITKTGIYKVDWNMLNAMGIGTSINPERIKLFGNGMKGILPQSNSENRPDDLLENAIFIAGAFDRSFDQNDYILFYGIGPDKEQWTATNFEFEKNIYSDTAYYFLTVGDTNGKRVTNRPDFSGTTMLRYTSFDDFIAYEEDQNNLISSGRIWVGEALSNNKSQIFPHQIDRLSSDISITLSGVSQSSEEANFNVLVESTLIGSIPVPAIPTGPGSVYSIKARHNEATFTIPQNERFGLKIEYRGGTTNARGFLDRYYMTFQKTLRLYNNETDFRVIGHPGAIIQYEIEDASLATIWNVTDPVNVIEQEYSISDNRAVFKSQSPTIEEFIVFRGSDFPAPFICGKIANQNLRGDTNYEGLIITPVSFIKEANRLAQFHRDHDDLSVKVVTLPQIYNEFSSGRQDVTAIRDYAKYVYETGRNLKYLLLFGDCSYDYKDRVTSNTNIVLTYESRESFHPIFSYSSDDYFAFFGEDEGNWEESIAGDHTMEIGVGRLPVKSLDEAKTIVDKIIYYCKSPNTLGKWKNEITYLADDGDANLHAMHVEALAELVDTTYAQYNISKLLLDAFDQESGVSRNSSPQTTTALKTRIKNGTFLINYIGHGNEHLWTEEEVLNQSVISKMTNRNKLPIFVTATCEFGRYDDPTQVSGAEKLILSRKGGGIALLTTSRPVFANTNFVLNRAFHENIFMKIDEENQRLGDIIRLTKNEGLAGPVNRNFILLGDPMMRPAFPKFDIVINHRSNEPDTLSALEKISFTGEIQSNGMRRNDFTGQLIVEVFDVKQNFKTKGQESSPYTYSLRNNALFRGNVTVEGGQFSFSFIVPKNISYQYQKGKMSLYAWDEENNVDATGTSREFVIGGTNGSVPVDHDPPRITMYINDENFMNNDIVGSSSLLIARISDKNGITTTRSGVLEGITLELDDEVLNLNDFYTASVDSYQEGVVLYPIQDLEPGQHSATLRVWDTHNNSSTSSIDFLVTGDPTLFVFNHVAYPNPVTDRAIFYFEHDREDEDLEIMLTIYGSRGEIINHQKLTFENSSRTIEIPWETNKSNKQRLNKGVYYYQLIIRSKLDGATKKIARKLVITN